MFLVVVVTNWFLPWLLKSKKYWYLTHAWASNSLSLDLFHIQTIAIQTLRFSNHIQRQWQQVIVYGWAVGHFFCVCEQAGHIRIKPQREAAVFLFYKQM
jgi:hypothetical protein